MTNPLDPILNQKIINRNERQRIDREEFERSLKPVQYLGRNIYQELGQNATTGRFLGKNALIPGTQVPNIAIDRGFPIVAGIPIETQQVDDDEEVLLFYYLRFYYNEYLLYNKLNQKTLLTTRPSSWTKKFIEEKFNPIELIYSSQSGEYVPLNFDTNGYLGWWNDGNSLLYVDGKFILGFPDSEGFAIVGENDNVYNYDGGGTGGLQRFGIPVLFSTDGIQWGAPTLDQDPYTLLGFTRFDENDALSVSLFAFSEMTTTYNKDLSIIVHRAVDSIDFYLSRPGKDYPVAFDYPSLGCYYVYSTDKGYSWKTGMTKENTIGFYSYQFSNVAIEGGRFLNGVINYPIEERTWGNLTSAIIDTFNFGDEYVVTSYLHERNIGTYFNFNLNISKDTGSTAQIITLFGFFKFVIIDIEQIPITLQSEPSNGDIFVSIARDISPGLGAARRAMRVGKDPFHFENDDVFRVNRVEGNETSSNLYLSNQFGASVSITNQVSKRDGSLISPTYTDVVRFNNETVVSKLTFLRAIPITGTIKKGVDFLYYLPSNEYLLGWDVGSTFRLKYAYTENLSSQKRYAYSPEVYTVQSTFRSTEITDPITEGLTFFYISAYGNWDIGDVFRIKYIYTEGGADIEAFTTETYTVTSLIADLLGVKVTFFPSVITPTPPAGSFTEFVSELGLITPPHGEKGVLLFSPRVTEPVTSGGSFLDLVSELGRLPPYHKDSDDLFAVRIFVPQPMAGDTTVVIDTKISATKNIGVRIIFEDSNNSFYEVFITAIANDQKTITFAPELPVLGGTIKYKNSIQIYYKDRFQTIFSEFQSSINRQYSEPLRNTQLVVSSVDVHTGATSAELVFNKPGLLQQVLSSQRYYFGIEKPNSEVIPIEDVTQWIKYCHFFQWQGLNKAIGFITELKLILADPQPAITIPDVSIFAEAIYSSFWKMEFSRLGDRIVGLFWEGSEIEASQDSLFPGLAGNIRLDQKRNTTQRSAGNSNVLVLYIAINGNFELVINTLEAPLVFNVIPNSSVGTMTPNGDGLFNVLGALHPVAPSDYSALWFDPLTDTINVAYFSQKLNPDQTLGDYCLYVATTINGVDWRTTEHLSNVNGGEVIPCIYAEVPPRLVGKKSNPPIIQIS